MDYFSLSGLYYLQYELLEKGKCIINRGFIHAVI